MRADKYLLLTEFEGRTVSYGPSFFLLDLWPKREARGPCISVIISLISFLPGLDSIVNGKIHSHRWLPDDGDNVLKILNSVAWDSN